MSRRRDRLAALLVVLIAGASSPPCPAAGPVPGGSASTGTVRLASGATAHYAFHYDRNAMADALLAGDAILVLTDSGTLLRFDRSTLKLIREWVGPVPATCLGRGEGGAAIAGLADGRIVRIDPASLAPTELARVPGKVQWAGATSGAAGAKPRLVAVVERAKAYKSRGTEYQAPQSVVHDLGSGKTYTIEEEDDRGPLRYATAFRLDRKDRLWLGADLGEWGGWCSCVDLGAGQVHPIPGLKIYAAEISKEPAWLGVYGFAELRDGQVWAHGGTSHMGRSEGFIWRVDRGKAEELYRAEDDPAGDDDAPTLPITHVIEDPASGSLRVLAFNEIYRTDARLGRWEKRHGLGIRYRWGRRDAVGAYPSVRAVLPIGEPGRSTALLFATRLDGLVRLADGEETAHALPGQFEGESIGRIANSSEGLLALDDIDEEVWRYRDGAWGLASFAPPYRPRPGAPDAVGEVVSAGWCDTKVLIGRDGSIITVSASSRVEPGTRTTARWRDGKAEVLGSEVATFDPSACFLTPDGTLWNAQRSTLRRFVDGRWVEAGAAHEGGEVPRADWNDLRLNLVAVNDAGPPWILHDADHRLLLRMTYGDGFKDPRLSIEVPAGAGPRRFARDAIPWTKAELLLATEDGLKTFAMDGGRLAIPPLNTGGRSVARLARDGRGRTWLGGEGLAVLDAEGKALHPLDELPMLGRSRIAALAADPAHPDGAIAAVEGRGVVFVRVEVR